MAQYVTELGNALETAIKANTDLRLCFPDPLGASAYAVEYNAQRTEFVDGVAQCFIRPDGYEIAANGRFDTSALGIFRFEAWMQLIDVKGANGRLAQCLKGIANVFADFGNAVLNTHLTDSGSNRLGKSGEVRHSVAVDPLDAVDPDRPVVRVDVEIECGVVSPLV